MKTELIIVGVLIVLLGAALIFGANNDTESLSTISNAQNDVSTNFYPTQQLMCEVPQDCYDILVNSGVKKSDLDNALLTSKLTCQNNVCGVNTQ